MTAVSKFIAREMFLQWGFEVERVIDNGVDTRVYRPALQRVDRPRPIVIHGVNDVTNENKGWRHIKELEEYLDADVMSLDHAYSRMSSTGLSKPEVLAQADLIVHSSGFEGNSMFIAESLACGVPIVAYNVGYLSEFFGDRAVNIGVIMDRRSRSPKLTLDSCREVLSSSPGVRMQMGLVAQELAPSLDRFVSQWRSYVEEVENA
jgi:glycosyltransferase involved in cell wall biosynthesis